MASVYSITTNILCLVCILHRNAYVFEYACKFGHQHFVFILYVLYKIIYNLIPQNKMELNPPLKDSSTYAGL
jgi:hypothetical protein